MFRGKSYIEILKVICICAVTSLSLFLGFFSNEWGVADQKWFDDHQHDMENHILGRLVKSRQDGMFSEGGLIGIGCTDTAQKNHPDFYRTYRPFENQRTAYLNQLSFPTYSPITPLLGARE